MSEIHSKMEENDMRLSDLPPEMFSDVGGFLSGKAVSTFGLVAETCNTLDQKDTVLRSLVPQVYKRGAAFLEDGPPALQECFKLLTAKLLSDEEGAMTLRKLSEWCAVLDYCEQCPGILAEFYKESYNNDATTPGKKCWLIGGGFLTPRVGELNGDEPLQTSQAVLTSHIWEPQVIVLADEWFSPEVKWAYKFLMGANADGEGSQSYFPFAFPFASAAGILSWRDENAIAIAHRQTDIEAGMVARQHVTNPFSALWWMPSSTRDVYPIDALMQSQGLSWLTEIAPVSEDVLMEPNDNHMPCAWDIEEEGRITVTPAQFVEDGTFANKVLQFHAMLNDLW